MTNMTMAFDGVRELSVEEIEEVNGAMVPVVAGMLFLRAATAVARNPAAREAIANGARKTASFVGKAAAGGVIGGASWQAVSGGDDK